MKLNCDMGESFGAYKIGRDEQVMEHVHMANIACGAHAGDPMVMEKTVALARKYGVTIGAHPGYPDLQGFGRRAINYTADEVRTMIIYQTGALAAFCMAAGTRLGYVKPHGSLYNTMMENEVVLTAVFQAVVSYDADIPVMIQATPRWQHHEKLARENGINLLWEAFADRAYESDGSLRKRNLSGAVLGSDEVIKQAQTLCEQHCIISSDGMRLEFPVDALCVHGDSESSISVISQLRKLVDSYEN
ncbi:MAG: 5-oxoprolinase subunit PxpA [Desulfobulbaceae bacterium]|nr:MAG: 5-oxoprolinase subunit PxpA [Desulfobulbaceae bacterium]